MSLTDENYPEALDVCMQFLTVDEFRFFRLALSALCPLFGRLTSRRSTCSFCDRFFARSRTTTWRVSLLFVARPTRWTQIVGS